MSREGETDPPAPRYANQGACAYTCNQMRPRCGAARRATAKRPCHAKRTRTKGRRREEARRPSAALPGARHRPKALDPAKPTKRQRSAAALLLPANAAVDGSACCCCPARQRCIRRDCHQRQNAAALRAVSGAMRAARYVMIARGAITRHGMAQTIARGAQRRPIMAKVA